MFACGDRRKATLWASLFVKVFGSSWDLLWEQCLMNWLRRYFSYMWEGTDVCCYFYITYSALIGNCSLFTSFYGFLHYFFADFCCLSVKDFPYIWLLWDNYSLFGNYMICRNHLFSLIDRSCLCFYCMFACSLHKDFWRLIFELHPMR